MTTAAATTVVSTAAAEAAFLPQLAFALACGYLLHEKLSLRKWLREYPGHVLYFRVLVIGLVWVALCGAVRSGLGLAEVWRAADLGVALLLRFALTKVQDVIFSRSPQAELQFYRRGFMASEMHFESHILRAIEHNLHIMITMESGKVYIGLVKSVRRRSDARWMTMIPVLSGYRDERLMPHITTDYSDALDRALSQGRDTELNLDITLPVEKTASLQFFDADFYRAMNRPAAG